MGQKAIDKEASKFAATRMQVLAACMQKQVPGLCPESKDTSKIEKAADKAAKKITKTCGSAEALAGLGTSYATVSDGDIIQSCTLSQHTAWTTVLLGNNNGTPGKIVDDKDRDKCAKELGDKAKNADPPYTGFSPDHVQEIQLNGHATDHANLRWMSSAPNSWIGGKLKKFKTSGPDKHTGVAPDCCG
jgi:hypothetical protein